MTLNGLNDANSDISTFDLRGRNIEDCNWAVVTGKLNNFFVFDVDKKNGGLDTINNELRNSRLPLSPTSNTGGGGFHVYFQYPSHASVRCSGGLFKGIDIKGDGGYVLIPPSNHVSKKSYSWQLGLGFDEIPLANAPDWLISKIKDDSSFIGKPKPFGFWSKKAQEKIYEGSRHKFIVQFTGRLIGKYLEPLEIMRIVTAINKTLCQPPLEADEVMRIINGLYQKKSQSKRGYRYV